VSALDRHPEVALCGTEIWFIDQNGADTSYPREFNRLHTFSMDVRGRARTLTDKLDWFAIYSVIRADILRQTRLSTEVYGSDVILLMELLLRGSSLILPEPLLLYRFVQKTADQHLEDVTGFVRRREFSPYTELAHELLHVIQESDCSAALKAEMCNDLIDNVCENNGAWSRNLLNENPEVRRLPPYRWHRELRKLFAPTEIAHALAGAAEDAVHRNEVEVPRSWTVPSQTFGFNAIGFVSGNLGLGVSARNTIAALLARGFPVSVVDLDPGEGRVGYDTRYGHLAVKSYSDLPYDVNLVVLPPNVAQGLVLQLPGVLARPDRINVLCTFWELTVLPEPWRRSLEFFDVIIAFSDYIRHTLDFMLSGPFVLSARQPLTIPAGISSQRERFGIEPDDVVFVTSLELGSDPMRKNAHTVIDAFFKGLSDVANARLIIRVNNVYPGAPAAPYLAALEKAAALDRRIAIRTEKLSYTEVLSLYKSADVYVSLHRSEGLGLAPLEAMALGKPAIATGWSGNMTYMNHLNACLVPYKLVPVEASVHEYSAQTLAGLNPVWADPDVEQAAIWMKRLATEEDLRTEIGRRASASIAESLKDAAGVRFADEIHNIWEQRRYSGVDPDWQRKLDALRDSMSGVLPKPIENENMVTRFRRRVGRFLDERVFGQTSS